MASVDERQPQGVEVVIDDDATATEVKQQVKQVKVDVKLSWPKLIGAIVGALVALYFFLVGLTLMGSAFKVLGGPAASKMFAGIDNPIAGLMTGVMATVLVQSSSTSTSIVVAMVGAGTLSVKRSIPVIMGANIGTSVTNSIVSMGSMNDRVDYQRAFAGATVHDMFNMLTVITLLPIEVIVGAIQGEGGPLYWISHAITEGLMGGNNGEELFESPIKAITKPVASEILKSNKYVIYALTLPKPEQRTPQSVNATACTATDGSRLLSEGTAGRALLSRRLEDDVDCSSYWCISKGLDKNFKKISKSSYKKLTACKGYVLDEEPCKDGEKCYMDGGAYYDKKVKNGALAKGGFLSDTGSDGVAGVLGLLISLVLLTGGLITLVSLLKMIFLSKAKSVLRYATQLNDYVAIAIGVGITILVQSSSVTTSALTPLCGVGALSLEKMLPLTLGANIGTTITALLASLVSLKFDAVQIALCHLLFNIVGILIWFPAPPMRKLPLLGARTLGLYASYYVWIPPFYIFGAFICVPGICLLISAIYDASAAGGVVVTIIALVGFAIFEYMWIIGYPQGDALCYKVMSKEQREEGVKKMERIQAALTSGDNASETSTEAVVAVVATGPADDEEEELQEEKYGTTIEV